MNLPDILKNVAVVATVVAAAGCTTEGDERSPGAADTSVEMVKFQLVRNATMKLTYGDTTFLIDPMLAAKGAYKGFAGTPRSELRNPLVELPIPIDEILKADAIILTHLHEDHWDEAAKRIVPRSMPIFTQNEADAEAVRADGFTNVTVLTGTGANFKGTQLIKTVAQHGSDQMYTIPQVSKVLGQVMGIVFQHEGYKTAYVVGDSIWTPKVEEVLTKYKPGVVFLNTGYAQIDGFKGSIIMGKEDLYRAYNFAPHAKIVGIHMEAVNHALLTRKELKEYIVEKRMDSTRALVPSDGQRYNF